MTSFKLTDEVDWLKPGCTNMRQWVESLLHQIMVWRQSFMWTNEDLSPIWHSSIMPYSKFKHFHSRNAFDIAVCKKPSILFAPQYLKPVGWYDTDFIVTHDDVIKWKHFPRYWPFVRGIHRSPVNSSHKGQWGRALMFSLTCAWINGWVNNGEAGALRRNRAHYNVTVLHWWHWRLS